MVRIKAISVLGVLSFLLLLGTAGGCDKKSTSVISGLSESQANEILVALDFHGIRGCTKEPQRARKGTEWKVVAPPSASKAAMALIVRLRLPKTSKDWTAEFLKDKPLMRSPSFDRQSLEYASRTDLKRALESIDRVLSAEVMQAIPTQQSDLRLSSRKTAEPRISVLITYSEPTNLYQTDAIDDSDQLMASSSDEALALLGPPVNESEVRSLVRGRISGVGIEDDNIEVVFKAVQVPITSDHSDTTSVEESKSLSLTTNSMMLWIITLLTVIIVGLTIHIQRLNSRIRGNSGTIKSQNTPIANV